MEKLIFMIILYLVPINIVNATLSAGIVDPLVPISPRGIESVITVAMPSELSSPINFSAAGIAPGLFIAMIIPLTPPIALEKKTFDTATSHFAALNTEAICCDKGIISAVPLVNTRILIGVPSNCVNSFFNDSCCAGLKDLGANFSSSSNLANRSCSAFKSASAALCSANFADLCDSAISSLKRFSFTLPVTTIKKVEITPKINANSNPQFDIELIKEALSNESHPNDNQDNSFDNHINKLLLMFFYLE